MLGDQYKSWAPLKVTNHCTCVLSQFVNRKEVNLKLHVTTTQKHYFCTVVTCSFNSKKCQSIAYSAGLVSAFLPVLHSDKIPFFLSLGFHEDENENTSEDNSSAVRSKWWLWNGHSVDIFHQMHIICCVPQRFSQEERSDLFRDLELLKQSSELLGSQFQEKNLLEKGISVSSCQSWKTLFTKHVSEYTGAKFRTFSYCHYVKGMLPGSAYLWFNWMGTIQWQLQTQLKVCSSTYENAAVPLSHSTAMKEKYEAVKTVLGLIRHNERNWIFWVHLKLINFLFGSNLVTPNTHVFFACGTATTEKIIGQEMDDLPWRSSMLVLKTFSTNHCFPMRT